MSRQSINTLTGEIEILPDAPYTVKSQAEIDAAVLAKEAAALAQFDTPVMQTMIESVLDLVRNPPDISLTAADLTASIKASHKANGRTV